MAEINTKNTTSYEEQRQQARAELLEYKIGCEGNIVAIIYKEPETIYDLKLTINDFSNNMWKVYFEIAQRILISENKKTLDNVTINVYLEKHPKLKEVYMQSGGYDNIQNLFKYIDVNNLDGFIKEFYKWKALLQLCDDGFPIKDKISLFADMPYEEIYNKFERRINNIFIDLDNTSKSYDICDGIDELIDKLDEGLAVGLPFANMDILTSETAGQCLGNITLVGGVSNVGKSSFARTVCIPSIIDKKEKLVIMLNEENLEKWQRELIVYVANNIIKEDLTKGTLRKGKYTDETRSIIRKSIDWIKENTKNHTITIIPFQRYSTSTAIKVMRKYSTMGVKYFILDTFKMDDGTNLDHSWLAMTQSMVDIYNCVKPDALNVHILITFQLNKQSVSQRFLSMSNIGLAKNIVDTASTCLLVRNVLPDEYGDGKNKLKVWKPEGENNKTKILKTLDKDRTYQLVFIAKNREGSANLNQIVIDHNLAKNTLTEVGLCNVPIDF